MSCLFVVTLNQVSEPIEEIIISRNAAVSLFCCIKNLLQRMFQALSFLIISAEQVKHDYRTLKPHLIPTDVLMFFNSESLEQLLLIPEATLQHGRELTLPEAPWSRKEIRLSRLHKIPDIFCLIYITKSVIDDFFKCLYANRQFLNRLHVFCFPSYGNA